MSERQPTPLNRQLEVAGGLTRKILLVAGCLAVLLASGCCTKCVRHVSPAPPKYITLYSCDNVDVLGEAPCNEPEDPAYMMIYIWEETPAPGTSSMEAQETNRPLASFEDPGTGVTFRVWKARLIDDTLWYQIQYQEKQGWVSSANARQSPASQ